MKRTLLTSVIVGAALGVVFVTSGTDAHASEVDGVWTPRTVDQIKADINKAKDNKYTIVWGDTLSGISQATNITVQKLADMNKIANVDLIYAGNMLVFEGNVVTTQDANGETVAQTVIQPEDKNDSTKPVGKQEATGQAVSEGTIGSENTTTAAQAETSQAAPTVGEYGQLEGFYSKEYTEDGWKYVEAGPFRTDKDFKNWFAANYPNAEESEGFWTLSGDFDKDTMSWSNLVAKKIIESVSTPAQPAEQPAPSTSAESQPSTSDNQDGGTTLEIEKDMNPINVGNSGEVFNTRSEADAYGYAQLASLDGKWGVNNPGKYGRGYSFVASELVNKNFDSIGKWTVDFVDQGSASTDIAQ